MGAALTYTERMQMVVEYCYSCGVPFGMTTDFRRIKLDNRHDPRKNEFYCPNGHGQIYTGKTEEQRQRERAERLAAKLTHTEDQLQATEARRRAEKGAKTKMRNRIKNGVCIECKRSFPDLKAHMDTKHPEVERVDASQT